MLITPLFFFPHVTEMLMVGQTLALLPLGAAVGAAIGFLKERKSKRSPMRWFLRLAPLALLPLVR